MELITTIEAMRNWTDEQKKQGKVIGFVPTMGSLHAGHLSLVEKAVTENHKVIMSIFVNPMQFGPQEDFAVYPRDLERDALLAREAGVDAIFHPSAQEIYPQYPPLTAVEVGKITEELCGSSRPGHFAGVATVVIKLFNIVQPHRAYFGQKDYQQLLVIKQMVKDLNLPLAIEMVPIKREKDGLAMSSRNAYLSPAERQEALALHQALTLCRQMFHDGEKRVTPLVNAMRERIQQEPSAIIDYIEIRHPMDLSPIEEVKESAVVALAVHIGKTRLIDNLILEG